MVLKNLQLFYKRIESGKTLGSSAFRQVCFQENNSMRERKYAVQFGDRALASLCTRCNQQFWQSQSEIFGEASGIIFSLSGYQSCVGFEIFKIGHKRSNDSVLLSEERGVELKFFWRWKKQSSE